MKTLTSIFVFTLLIALITSCSTSNSVVSNKFLQKRKYKKGFHISKKQKRKDKINTKKEKYIKIPKDYNTETEEKVVFEIEKTDEQLVLNRAKKRNYIKSEPDKENLLIKKPKQKDTLEKRKLNSLKNIRSFIPKRKSLSSNISKQNQSSLINNMYYWNWNAILIASAVILFLTVLIAVIGWPVFIALLGKACLYLIATLATFLTFVIIITVLIVATCGIALLFLAVLPEEALTALTKPIVDAIFSFFGL